MSRLSLLIFISCCFAQTGMFANKANETFGIWGSVSQNIKNTESDPIYHLNLGYYFKGLDLSAGILRNGDDNGYSIMVLYHHKEDQNIAYGIGKFETENSSSIYNHTEYKLQWYSKNYLLIEYNYIESTESTLESLGFNINNYSRILKCAKYWIFKNNFSYGIEYRTETDAMDEGYIGIIIGTNF